MYGARDPVRGIENTAFKTDRGSLHLARKNVKADHGSLEIVSVTVVVNCDLFLC